MRLFFSAGEASGDAYGAEIARALTDAGAFSAQNLADDLVKEFSDSARDIANAYFGSRVRALAQRGQADRDTLLAALVADIESGDIELGRLHRETVSCVGGKKLKAAGVGLTFDSSDWGAVGIIESLFVAPKVIEGFFTARSLIRSVGHGLFIPIDFGYMNVKLAREAKKHGWKVLYFVPPGSWRRNKQGSDLPGVTDAIVTPFQWSADILNGMGANAHFFGHPLKEMVQRAVYDGPRDGLAVLPGSRLHEVARNMDVIAEAVKGLDVKVKFAVAPNLDVSQMERQWEDFGGPEAEFVQDTYQVLKSSRAAVVCSGTATLEAALCRCPLVVVYRVSKLAEMEFRIRRPKFDYISLPNILLDRKVLTELIQYDASPERIRHEVELLLAEGPERQSQLDAFKELDSELGDTGCFERTAQLALALSKET